MADETSQPNLVQQYSESVRQRQLEAEAQMQKLINSLNARKNMPFDPTLMRVAGALLSPTKTGSFGESLGYAATAATDEAQKQAQMNAELAKLEYELSQKKAQQEQAADLQKFRMQYFGGQGAPAAPQTAAAPQEPTYDFTGGMRPIGKLEATPPMAARPVTAQPQMPVAEAPKGAVPTSQFRSPQDIAILSVVDPEGAKIAMQMEEMQRKNEELRAKQKEAEAKALEQELKQNSINVFGTVVPFTKVERDGIETAIKDGDIDFLRETFRSKGLESPYELKDGAIQVVPADQWTRKQEAAKQFGLIKRKWKGETHELDADQALEHDKARKAGKLNEFWNSYFAEQSGVVPPVSTTATPKADSKAAPAKVEPTPSVEQKEVSQEAAKTRERKRAEETINFETNLTETAKQSGNLRRTANTILSLINDEKYSGAQGYFAQPGLKNAIATFLEEGFQFGNSRVALPGLTEAFKKIGMTPAEAEAEAILFQKTGELGLLVSKLQAGQGSVSNYERSVFEKIATSTKTPLIAMRSAMNALRARAVYDENIQKVYVDWSEKNPNKSSAAFIASPEYKRETARYENQLGMIEDQFFPKTKAPAAKPAAKPEAKPEGKPSSKFLQ